MRRSALPTIAALAILAGFGLVATPARLHAQSTGPAVGVPQPDIYMPFVFDNALDQKILDAQAQMIAPHRLLRLHRHHHRTHR